MASPVQEHEHTPLRDQVCRKVVGFIDTSETKTAELEVCLKPMPCEDHG